MTAPAKPKAPPPQPLRVAVNLPSMRVACTKCRHTSPTLIDVGNRVEVPLDCRCPIPDVVLVLGFPGKDLNVPLEPVGR